ncbi:unnamed protein product [Toxocara canis]|uniref:Uncharacterized protein n=1 Tax=Toxocara canis TaxID=6265 RepID=A0A183VDN2_TOXCA|nr:unnamed protein product [Toxocara canis]
MDIYCSSDAISSRRQSDWSMKTFGKEVTKDDDATTAEKRNWRGNDLKEDAFLRVRRSLAFSVNNTNNETAEILNVGDSTETDVKRGNEQLIMGHFAWYVLVILGVFIFLLIISVVITCYFDCQNRRSRLPRAARRGRPVPSNSPSSPHPLLSDDGKRLPTLPTRYACLSNTFKDFVTELPK